MDGGDGRVLSDSLPRPRDADGQIAGGRSTEGRNPSEDCSRFPGKGGRLVSRRDGRAMEQRLTMSHQLQALWARSAAGATCLGLVALMSVLTTRARAQQPAGAAEDGQWTMPGKNFALTRYSGLDQVNT